MGDKKAQRRRRQKRNMTLNYNNGSVVIIVSDHSKHLGKMGFVYKVHDSGRLGVMLPGGLKITYTISGVKLVTEPTRGREEDFRKTVQAKAAYFGIGLPSAQAPNVIPDIDLPANVRSSPSFGNGNDNGGTLEDKMTEIREAMNKLTLAVAGLNDLVATINNSNQLLMQEVHETISSLASRIDSVEQTTVGHLQDSNMGD